MIEFGPNGMRYCGFGSGQGSTRGRIIRSGNHAIYPDSSAMMQTFALTLGQCDRCGGQRKNRHAPMCEPCMTEVYG